MSKNLKYSHKDFTDKSLLGLPASDFDGEIVGSCFFQQCKEGDSVWKKIFPDGIKTAFIRCNLDNVIVPAGCTIKSGCHRAILMQNDRQDWILDAVLKPFEPIDKKMRLRAGISIDPKDIPSTKITQAQFEAQQKAIATPLPVKEVL